VLLCCFVVASPGVRRALARESDGPAGGAPTDLSVTLTDGPDPIAAYGDVDISELTYRAVVTNDGPAAAVQIEVVIPIPPQTQVAEAPAACTITGSEFRCSYPQLLVGASIETAVVVDVLGSAPALLAPPPTTVTALNPEIDPSDNSASTTTQVRPTAIAFCAHSAVAPLEGDTGLTLSPCDIELHGPHAADVRVEYTFEGETAVPGLDFVAASGTITFTPATSTMDVDLQVIGDTRPEGNDTYRLLLTSRDAFVLNLASFVIRDDDAPPGRTLTNGFVYRGDFVPVDAIDRRVDFFHAPAQATASYDVVVDEVTGAAAPVRLGMSAGIYTWFGWATGTGTSVRVPVYWPSTSPPPLLQVWAESLGCGTSCGPGDRYRLRAHETTLTGGRFQNAGDMTTIVLLQNAGSAFAHGSVDFWSDQGVLLGRESFYLDPRASRVFPVSNVPGLAGTSGSVTVLNTAAYGVLVGKTVVLDTRNGFAFESTLAPKPR
jgi:hypothetical protein